MITGAHTIIYSQQAEELREFFREKLGFRSVDAGRGWLIFALPPAELAVHPTEEDVDLTRHELFLMCDDIHKTAADLKQKGVELARPITEAPWGLVSAIKLPDGKELGIYEPRHPTAI
jgi:catechol 2,3-dioxygenase-like lactoylglutathione lyase family enzyme